MKNAVEQFNQSKKTELVKDKEVLTLHDCMALAAKHNLELKVQNLEKDAAKNIMMAELLGMLRSQTVSPDVPMIPDRAARRSQVTAILTVTAQVRTGISTI